MINIDHIVKMMQRSLSHAGTSVALHEPNFNANEWKYIKECLDTGWVSSVGKFVDKFERDLVDFTGAKYAVATVNGTAALHISYLLAGVKPADEVLVPTMTFVATVNAIAYCGATPHFIDSEEKTLGLNALCLDDYLKDITKKNAGVTYNRYTNKPIRALCVMHTLGHPVDLDPLVLLCDKYNLVLIEDAAEALGSYYKGIHVGHHGLLGALSFNGNKIITTGGGGAIITNHKDIALQAKHLTTTAKRPHAWLFEHDQVGYNYRLPNLNAALGCAQLEKITTYLAAKHSLMEYYKKIFSSITGLRLVQEPSFAKSNYWLNAFLLDENCMELRDKLLLSLNQNGIMTRPLWNLQHTSKMYSNCPRMPLSIAENLCKRLIKIPSSPQLFQAESMEHSI